MSRINFELELRDRLVEVYVSLVDADPSVGMMCESGEDEEIHDLDGNVLDWELTQDEWGKINQAIADYRF